MGAWSIMNSAETGPAFQLALSLGSCIYFLNDKMQNVARAWFGALVIGWLCGSIVVPMIPLTLLQPTWTIELLTSLRMKELHAKEASDETKMLRLSVETGGCSGFQYVFRLDDKRNEDDRIFEKEGVKLVVDNISYDFVKVVPVDYVEELLRSAFLVTANPSAVGALEVAAVRALSW